MLQSIMISTQIYSILSSSLSSKFFQFISILIVIFCFSACRGSKDARVSTRPKVVEKPKKDDDALLLKELMIKGIFIDTLMIDKYAETTDGSNIKTFRLNRITINQADIGNQIEKIKKGTLDLAELRLSNYTHSHVKDGEILSHPEIEELLIDTLFLELEDTTLMFFSFDIPWPNITSLIVKGKKQKIDVIKNKSNLLKKRIDLLQSRLEEIKELVELTLIQYPDHAIRNIPPELNQIAIVIDKILSRYNTEIERRLTPKRLSIDTKKLKSISITFDDIEKEAIDPNNQPIKFENKLFFEKGEFKITGDNKNVAAKYNINNIVSKVRALYELDSLREIKIYISTTGYADDLSPGDSKIKEINRELDLVEQKFNSDKEKDDFYNQKLSLLRAKEISNLITIEIKKKVGVGLIFIENSDCRGKGTEYPSDYNGTCTGDCQDRRVTNISQVIVTYDHEEKEDK